MQSIAAFAGYSETAFVLSALDETHDIYVRYFTPTVEVPICGHATIATHFLRVKTAGDDRTRIIAKTGAGIMPVDIERDGQDIKIVMTQQPPEFGHIFTDEQRAKLASALNIAKHDVVDELPIQIVSTGHSKVMIPLESTEILDRLAPDMEALKQLSKEVGCNGFFPFVTESSDYKAIRTFGRMFAPAIGIDEDPVTGNANGPAGAYLARYGILAFDERTVYKAYQGIAMGKPGEMEVRLTRANDGRTMIRIAGNAVESGQKQYLEPP